jgi:hypothetical protein
MQILIQTLIKKGPGGPFSAGYEFQPPLYLEVGLNRFLYHCRSVFIAFPTGCPPLILQHSNAARLHPVLGQQV